MMDELNRKYYEGRLTVDELIKLRQKEDMLDNDRLAEWMEELWEESSERVPRLNPQDTNCVVRIRQRLMDMASVPGDFPTDETQIFKLPGYLSWVVGRKLLGAVAGILLLLSAFIGYWIYEYRIEVASESLTIVTRDGEQMSVTLPDKSIVSLNELSSLTYTPAAFTEGKRTIDFDGEGYFQITNDADHPFVINANRMTVKVKGTKFELSDRKTGTESWVSLQEGLVELVATQSGKIVQLKPSQSARLEKGGEMFKIVRIDVCKIGEWREHKLVFRNTPLYQVLREISLNYGMNLKIDGVQRDELFTGTLPDNDIYEDLKTLEIVFSLKTDIIGNDISVQRLRGRNSEVAFEKRLEN